MPDQPAVADRPLKPGAVFVDAAVGTQEREVEQFDVDAPFLDGRGRVRNLSNESVGVSPISMVKIEGDTFSVILFSPSARSRPGGGRSVILLLQNHPDDEDQSGDDADLNP
jgi:hypothetical protein